MAQGHLGSEGRRRVRGRCLVSADNLPTADALRALANAYEHGVVDEDQWHFGLSAPMTSINLTALDAKRVERIVAAVTAEMERNGDVALQAWVGDSGIRYRDFIGPVLGRLVRLMTLADESGSGDPT